MNDLVERLRTENSYLPYWGPPALAVKAAARIEKLEAALREIAYYEDGTERKYGSPSSVRIARAALEERT